MGKVVLTVTIDAHLDQWIKQKGGMKSRIVNTILHKAWVNEGQKRPQVRPRSHMSNGMEEHMKKVWLEMGYNEDGSEKL